MAKKNTPPPQPAAEPTPAPVQAKDGGNDPAPIVSNVKSPEAAQAENDRKVALARGSGGGGRGAPAKANLLEGGGSNEIDPLTTRKQLSAGMMS